MSPVPLGILASAHSGAATYEAAVLADSPVWYFPLNDASGVPVDQMGYATSPSVVGTLGYGTAALGDRSTSIDFASDRVNVSSSPHGFANFTAECLVKLDSTGSPMNLMTQFTGLGFAGSVYIMAVVSAQLYCHTFTSSGSNAQGALYSGTTMNTTDSYHVAMTWASSYLAGTTTYTMRGFINGVRYINVSTSFAGTFGSGGGTVPHILGGDNIAGFPYDGKMAGAAFYTTALSDARILAHSIASGH